MITLPQQRQSDTISPSPRSLNAPPLPPIFSPLLAFFSRSSSHRHFRRDFFFQRGLIVFSVGVFVVLAFKELMRMVFFVVAFCEW